MEFNREDLESLITSGEFESLKDKSETDFFDCKSQVYHLKNNDSKFELAKDISAFANAQGGHILIGIKTEKCDKSFYDIITEISYVKQNLCNPKQYIDNINEWIYPKPERIIVKWYPSKADSEHGIFVITIPPQTEFKKPFIIKHTLKESGKRNSVLFGFSERIQDNNEPWSVVELQQLLRNGLNYYENLDNKLQSIDFSLQRLAVSSPELIEDVFDIEKRINTALTAVEMNKNRSMIICGYPELPNNLRTLFSSKSGSLKSILESPPKVRESGFGLRVSSKARIIGGRFCRVTGGKRKLIDLYKDGFLLAALKADEDFLCWGMNDILLNPVALIESIYNFVQLYDVVIREMSEKPNKVSVRVEMQNLHLNEKKTKLAEGNLENIKTIFPDEIKSAPEDSWSGVIDFEVEDFNIPKIAYYLTEIIYNFFEIEIEFIPYTKEVEGERIIDIEQIISL